MKRYYFVVASSLLLFLSLLAFSDNLITDVGQKSNSDPKFIIHGLFCFAWFIILVIQTNFVSKGNYKAHIRFGIFGLVVALGVFISSLYIFIVIYEGWDMMSYTVKANRYFMLSFGILVTLAYVKRKQLGEHKRLMYLATLYMLGPILSRVMARLSLESVITSDVTWDITFHGTWTLFFITLFVYDLATLKKIHPVTYLVFIWYCLIWVVSVLI